MYESFWAGITSSSLSKELGCCRTQINNGTVTSYGRATATKYF
jgi:hypothetical protein